MKDREVAVYALMDIFEQEGYNNIVLRRTFKKYADLTSVQKAFITELVNGTLRNLILIDYVIDKFSKTKTKKMKPLILNILRISVYQFIFMDKVPVSAVCNEAVDIAKKRGFRGLSGFVNGVLRNISKNVDNVDYPDIKNDFRGYVYVKYSYPKWIIDYWLESLTKDEVMQMCEQNGKAPNVTAVVNTLKTTSDELISLLEKDGVGVEIVADFDNMLYIKRISDISENDSYKNGLFHIMDKSSFLAIKELAPVENEKIIDVCAAPGGKSFLSAYFMNNKGSISSRDVYEHKINLISQGADRLGIDIINAEIKDASENYEEDFKTADRVIVDAPCSGLGLVRKKPDIKYSKTYDDIIELVKIQRDILSASQNYVKDNGFLLYSTCTVSYKENQENVEWFLNNFDFELVSQNQILPQNFDSDGFFIAKFKRKAN